MNEMLPSKKGESLKGDPQPSISHSKIIKVTLRVVWKIMSELQPTIRHKNLPPCISLEKEQSHKRQPDFKGK